MNDITVEDADRMGIAIFRAMQANNFQPIDSIRALASALGVVIANSTNPWVEEEQRIFLEVVDGIRKIEEKRLGG